MASTETVEAEHVEVKQQEFLRSALKQDPAHDELPPPPVEPGGKIWFGGYAVVLAGLIALYYLFTVRFFGFSDEIVVKLQKYVLGAMVLVLVLVIAKASEVYLISRVEDPVYRFNLRRIQKLVTGLVLALIVISVLFVNWYAAAATLALVSLILGFALQAPITSFIGWIYIMVRAPYRVGDRIKIGDATGDVIDVSYLDTTLWEFGGDYLSTDHPTGRIIKIPNSEILNSAVYNYTSPLFPYVWNEVKFHVAYESDLEFVSQTMQQIAEDEVGEGMMERVRVYRDILAKTPVDQLQVREHPSVLFRVNENTWLEAIVRYLVHPKSAGRVKTKLIKRLLTELNAAPDRVMFPKGNMR